MKITIFKKQTFVQNLNAKVIKVKILILIFLKFILISYVVKSLK